MAPLSQIAIATSVLNRRVKDEVSYRKEYEQQKARIAKLEAGENADDENAEFQLKQEVGEICSCTVHSLILFTSILCTATILYCNAMRISYLNPVFSIVRALI